MRVLVIEDDADMSRLLEATLRARSLAVDTASDGSRGSYLARTNDYDLIILDQNLPGRQGLDVCRDIRQAGKAVPILFLTALGDPARKAEQLDSGADDSLAKPCTSIELQARIRALLRRGPSFIPDILCAGELRLVSESQQAKRGEVTLALTPKEFSLLELLLRRKGSVVSRSEILEHVWDMNGDPFSRSIETHVATLRKKIGSEREEYIKTVSGRGYMITL